MTHSYFGHFYNKSNFDFNKENIIQRRNNLQEKVMIMEIRNQGLCMSKGEYFHFELWNELGKLFNFS